MVLKAFAIAVLLLLLSGPMTGLAAAATSTPATPAQHQLVGLTPSTFGAPPPISGKIDSSGNFVMVIVPELASYQPLGDGDTVFGDLLNVYIFSTHAANGTEPIHYFQVLPGNNQTPRYFNTSATTVAGQLSEIDLTLPTSVSQTSFVLNVNGAVWKGVHLTPFTLLPIGTFTIGGLDLLILVIVVEFAIFVAPMILLARYLVRKAIYAPHFSLLLWGHVILIGTAGLLFTDYQALDAAFGGLTYFAYPIIMALLLFLWSLHLFNRADIVEILKPDTMNGHRLRYLRWTQLTGQMKDGRTVLIDPRWRGFLYGLLGHYTTLIPAESQAGKYGEPAPADIENRKIISRDEMKRELKRQVPSKQRPEDDFRILNAEKFDEPIRLWWVDSRDSVDVKFPRMSYHKWVEVPAKVDRNGVVVTESHRERKLTWPHIEEPESTIRLAGVHYYNTPIAALGWSRAEDDFALLEKRAFQVVLLRSRLHSESDRLTEERLAEFINLMEHQTLPLNEAETQDETERRPRIVDGKGNWYDNADDRGRSDEKPRPRGFKLKD